MAAFADAPAGYYNSLNGKKSADLKLAVHNVVKNFTKVSSYSDLPRYFQHTDVYPQSRRWWDMYSDIPLYAPSFAGLNREHSFPKSWWGGSTTVNAYVDLNHLYPSEAAANMAKSNYPLGTVNRNHTVNFQNGVTTVGIPVNGQGGGAALVFEPDDEYKGDFARTYFYMVTAYQDLTWKYTFMVNNNTYPTLNTWSVNLLLKWHRDDPVSQKERDRNDVVYSYQNNRNPFIDMPELAEYIWGTKVGEAFTPGDVTPPSNDPTLIAPSVGMELQFGQVAIGQSATAKLFVHSKDLKNPMQVQLYSGNSSQFSIATTAIPADLANSDNGYWLNVTYRPTELGEHTSRLLLSGDFDGSRGVGLRAECLPVPVLSACTATAPSDIENDRYVANWTAPANDVIDYFIVTRNMYTAGNVVTEELLAEENYLAITEFDKSDSESYSVQSVRLGVRSPMSNVVFVDHSGITGVETEQPLVVQGFDGFMRIICSAPQTDCTVFDVTGRTITMIEQVEDATEISLPTGIYFVSTRQHRTPIKVIIR